jgi:hypothetical protein
MKWWADCLAHNLRDHARCPRLTPFDHNNVKVAQAFATAMLAAPTTYNNNLLPPKLAGSKQARHHKFIKEWLKAEVKEYLSHNENGTWNIVVYLPKGFFALSTTWVYKYKLNDAGKLVCFKANVIVDRTTQLSERPIKQPYHNHKHKAIETATIAIIVRFIRVTIYRW